MSDTLKRIEKKHAKGRTPKPPRHRGVPYCYACAKEGWPCDVVKLAWALDEAIGTLKLLGVDASAAEYERTLEEVAGDE